MLHKAVLHLLFSVIWILQYVDIIAIQKYGCIVFTTRFKASTISRCSLFSVNTGYAEVKFLFVKSPKLQSFTNR